MKITGQTGIKNLEKYAKEIKRKHFKENNIRVFKSPNLSSSFIIVKDLKFKMVTWDAINSDKSKFRATLENFDKLLDAEY